jgi:hypothetical protein
MPEPETIELPKHKPKGWMYALLVVLLVVLTAGVVWYVQEQRVTQNAAKLAETQLKLEAIQKQVEVLEAPGEPAVASSKIRGTLTYPSHGVPKDVNTCAMRVDTGKTYCTKEQIVADEFKTKVGYEIAVDPGEYIVFSYRSAGDGTVVQTAAHDEYIKRTMLDEAPPNVCANTDFAVATKVSVGVGETKKDIISGDWYYPEQLINC